MKLNKIELINFRGISDMEIEFDKRATVIYGINGMGKSAILEASNILFSKILSEAAMDSHIGSCVITKKDVKAGETKLDAWRDNIFEGKADFTLFFEWFRSRQEYENSVKIEDGTFVDKQSEAARAAILKVLGQNFSNLRIKVTEDEAELVLEKMDAN